MNFPAKLPTLLLPVLILPVLVLPFLALPGLGQAPSQPAAAEIQTVGHLDPGSIAREIDDPSSGARWVLIRGSGNPGGPGRLVQITGLMTGLVSGPVSSKDVSTVSPTLREIPTASSYIPVVRAGDTLVLEEHTGVADTRLEGIALGPARLGAVLRARLKLGGRIVHAIATGPGHATFAPDTETWQ